MNEKAPRISNSSALERTLSSLDEQGRLEEVDAALIALCRSTAAAVDEVPDRASLVKEYRECLILLGGLGTDEPDALDNLLRELSGATVGNTPPAGTPDIRTPARADR